MGSQPTHQHSQPTKLYNYFKQHFTKQVKMKVSQVAAVLAVTASASAAPWRDGKSWGGHWKGGWKNGHEQKRMDGPFEFTSTYSVVATPDQVVDSNNNPTGGLAGAKGLYEYGINSKEDYICWNIVLENFRGDYQSPADTATHIHEAPKGKSGPPRLAFPNPAAFFTDVHSSLAVPGAV